MGNHPLAEALNGTIRSQAPGLWTLLSQRGQALFFPRQGILGQSAEARGTRVNATIGIALEDGGQPLSLSQIVEDVLLSPGSFLPYAPSEGLRELREVWGEKIRRAHPTLSSVGLPVVAAGITHALSVVATLFLDPGDELLLFDPSWDNYALIAETMHGARLRQVPLFSEGRLNVAGLAAALGRGEGKRTVLLNFPHNPTGYSPSLSEAKELASTFRGFAESGGSLVVILDDAYEGFVYEEGIVRQSLLSYLADLHERIVVVKIDGASKEEYAWGLRIGFVTVAGRGLTADVLRAVEEKLAGAVRATVSNASHLSQRLLLRALIAASLGEEQRKNFEILRARYHAAKAEFSSPESQKSCTLLPCNGGYFLCVKLPEGTDAERVRAELRTVHSVGVIALPENLLRVAFSSVPECEMLGLARAVLTACRTVAR